MEEVFVVDNVVEITEARDVAFSGTVSEYSRSELDGDDSGVLELGVTEMRGDIPATFYVRNLLVLQAFNRR